MAKSLSNVIEFIGENSIFLTGITISNHFVDRMQRFLVDFELAFVLTKKFQDENNIITDVFVLWEFMIQKMKSVESETCEEFSRALESRLHDLLEFELFDVAKFCDFRYKCKFTVTEYEKMIPKLICI